jgi:hypothetical protein
VLRSLTLKVLDHYDGAVAVTQCGSGSDGSKFNFLLQWITALKILQNATVFTFPIHMFNFYFNHSKSEETVAPALGLTLICFQKVGVVVV